MRLIITVCFIGFGLICSGYGQFENKFNHNFNLPKMIEQISSHFSTSQDLKTSSSDLNSILNQYNDIISGGASDQFLKVLLTQTDKNKTRCFQDIQYVFQNLQAKDMWGLKMLDAFGKPDSGILEGHLKWLGNYHECLKIYAPPNENSTAGDFNGQYCTLGLSVEGLNITLPVTLGVCLPESCGPVPADSFKDIFSAPEIISQMINVNITQKICQPTSKKWTSSAIAMICLLSFFAALAVIGSSITAIEHFVQANVQEDTDCRNNEQVLSRMDASNLEQQQGQNSSSVVKPHGKEYKGWYGNIRDVFNCFCIFTNGEKLLNTDGTEGHLLCLHGIRFLSMSWVIVCHTYQSIITVIGNPFESLEIIDTWLFQIIMNGFYCVDSFFLLSGFLVAYLFFQEATKRKGKFPWLYFYIHRYIRLTPVYMIALGYITAVTYYVGFGPFWITDALDPTCKKYWFYNMLYINNFVPQEKQCMPWSWYLANDMQFFVFSPILLYTLFRWPAIGYSILGIFMSASVAANFGITYHLNIQTGYGKVTLVKDFDALMAQLRISYDEIYNKPYTRMSPYLVGIALAYYLFKRKQNDQGKLNWKTLSIGWIVASASTLACLFYLYRRKLSVVESSFYNALNRGIFACGLGWVIFTCLIGQGGPVDRILSFKLFIPLSRLTYCAYLIHPIIMNVYFMSLKVPLTVSHLTMVTIYLGMLVATYAFSFVVSLVLESPIIRLEKVIRTKFTS